MLKRNTSMAIAATAAILALTACNQSEPTAVDSVAKTTPAEESFKESSLGDGRAMTPAEVAEYLAMKKADGKAPEVLQPSGPAPLAKTAAATCIVNFQQYSALAALQDHAASTFVVGPWYTHTCYNNSNYWVRATPLNQNHYHLMAEAADQCFYSQTKWGHKSGASCINPSDAAYWARSASNMSGNSGIDFVAAANGYYRNFNLVAFYVRSGTVKVIANRIGIGWWVWYGNTAGNRWYWPANTTVSEAQFFDNSGNGVFTMDNLEVQIL